MEKFIQRCENGLVYIYIVDYNATSFDINGSHFDPKSKHIGFYIYFCIRKPNLPYNRQLMVDKYRNMSIIMSMSIEH